jgi:hypothetical protein
MSQIVRSLFDLLQRSDSGERLALFRGGATPVLMVERIQERCKITLVGQATVVDNL